MLYFISMMLCIFTFSIFQTSSSLNGFGTQLITLQSVEVALTPVMVKVPYIYLEATHPRMYLGCPRSGHFAITSRTMPDEI